MDRRYPMWTAQVKDLQWSQRCWWLPVLGDTHHLRCRMDSSAKAYKHCVYKIALHLSKCSENKNDASALTHKHTTCKIPPMSEASPAIPIHKTPYKRPANNIVPDTKKETTCSADIQHVLYMRTIHSLSPFEIQDRCFSDIWVYGLIRSSTVTAANALMLEDTVLRLIYQQNCTINSKNHQTTINI